MKVLETTLADCLLIEPMIYKDSRGSFLETFQYKKYQDLLGLSSPFVQDNFSTSARGVLRGLHFQENNPQGKLIRISNGKVLDVALDLRPNSRTFGKWMSVILSSTNNLQLWIPPGFAHGFLALSESVHFEYKCTQYYDPFSERTILWNDPDLGIDWPKDIDIQLSEKDKAGQLFGSFNF
jgi:dTDP-4-dehydrorhamnose 3,5-epimerase